MGSVWGRNPVGPTGGAGTFIMPFTFWWGTVSACCVCRPGVLTGLFRTSSLCLGVRRVTSIQEPNSLGAKSLSVWRKWFWWSCESVWRTVASCNVGCWAMQVSSLCPIRPHAKHRLGTFSYWIACVNLPMVTWCHNGLSISSWTQMRALCKPTSSYSVRDVVYFNEKSYLISNHL